MFLLLRCLYYFCNKKIHIIKIAKYFNLLNRSDLFIYECNYIYALKKGGEGVGGFTNQIIIDYGS